MAHFKAEYFTSETQYTFSEWLEFPEMEDFIAHLATEHENDNSYRLIEVMDEDGARYAM